MRTKPPAGQAPHTPTEDQRKRVSEMVAFGISQMQIAGVMGMDEKTLRKYYREELNTGSALANEKVAKNLFAQAMKDDFRATPAAMFWAKTRMGWREKVDLNISGSLGINFDQMTDEELDEFIASREDS